MGRFFFFVQYRIGPSPLLFAISICPENMNVYARFDEILSMTLYVM